MRNLIVGMALLVLAAPMGIAAGSGEPFNELARAFEPEDPGSLAAIRPALDGLTPDCFKEPMDPGPLRSKLARELSNDEVRGLFEESRSTPETLACVTRNLSSRPGLSDLIVELDLVTLLADADVWELLRIGVLSLLDDRPALAAAIIAIPSLTLDMADELLDLKLPEGLCFLADVVSREIRIPEEALALLPLFQPDSYNREEVRVLRSRRREALGRVASSSPDYALRTLAARLLVFSGSRESFEPAVLALRDAQSCRIERGEWRSLGDWCGLPVLYPGLSLSARYEMFQGALQGSWIGAADADPAGAEVHAALLRRFFEEVEEPRLAAATIRILDWNGPDFLLRGGLRARHVPSYGVMLKEFADARPDDPGDLARIKLDFARRNLALAGTERGESGFGSYLNNDTGGSAVFELLPKQPGLSINWGPLVDRWLETDPDHLFDPVIHDRLSKFPSPELATILRCYPREEILRMLRHPPTRYRIRGRPKLGNDGTGRVNRGRILELLHSAPELCELLLTPGLVSGFPPENRSQAGPLLHLLPESEERDAVLADEETFAGFLAAVIERPRGEEIDLAARVISGLAGSDLVRTRVAHWVDHELRFRLAMEDDEPWPTDPGTLSEDLRAPLLRVLREAADPALASVAARIFAMSGTDRDVASLLFAGKDLDLTVARRGHPLAALADSIDSPMRLGLFLMFFRRNEATPLAQAEVFARLAEFNWLGRMATAERETALKVLFEFVEREIPALGGDRPEAFLSALLTNPPETMAHRIRPVVDEAIRRLPLQASRIRLRYLAANPR